jgi:predicted Zn-dependent protease
MPIYIPKFLRRFMRRWRQTLLLVLVTCTAFSSGCASVQLKPQRTSEPKSSPKPNTSSAIQAYESQRADALYLAACSRWEEDNLEACEKTLQQLLALQPTHKLGRLMLADLFAATDRLPQAERELTGLLRNAPNDPQIHHSLGLFFETVGEKEKALQHLKKSTELEPSNELYALSHETLSSAADE